MQPKATKLVVSKLNLKHTVPIIQYSAKIHYHLGLPNIYSKYVLLQNYNTQSYSGLIHTIVILFYLYMYYFRSNQFRILHVIFQLKGNETAFQQCSKKKKAQVLWPNT